MLNREARQFNERQQRSNEYYDTAGRGLSRIEDELRMLNTNIAILISVVEKLVQPRRSSTDQRRSNPNER